LKTNTHTLPQSVKTSSKLVSKSDKAKGKSGGYRTYYYTITDESITFLILYDKSEIQSIDEIVLDSIIAEIE
jgi:hypothetical protein